MKKFFLPSSIFCLLLSFLALTSFTPARKVVEVNSVETNPSAPERVIAEESNALSAEVASNLLYDSLHLEDLGMPRQVLQYAFKGQQQLANRGELNNKDIIAVCDFSQASNKKRLYIIDTKNFRVLVNTYVAHGKNSGVNYAERFSNTPESLQSSLGFYVTKGTYFGKHGLSLKLEGLERGFNDNAEARAVVMHGAEYIGTNRLGSSYMGRSFGCPAVPQAQSAKIINMLKNGTCLFIYHPTQKYLKASKILNA